ncbi:MAG: hypothetical protein U1E10_04590 [Bdellovibrionales bacterium]|jgi:hypothetical protein|nr:hypothetical protein [Bdellovibrionales bacterium]
MLGQKWNELVSKILERFTGKIRNSFRETDDTVEGQSKAFRLWMFTSTAAILMMLLLSFASTQSSVASSKRESNAGLSLIEQVPDGFVLVPIEPLNFETIDALIENHAYVDLYLSSGEENFISDSSATDRRKRLIARGLPLVRAPRNPSKFAVLVKEADTAVLMRLGAPVLVVVRKGPPKGGYPEPRKMRSRANLKRPKADFIFEEIPETETQNVNDGK